MDLGQTNEEDANDHKSRIAWWWIFPALSIVAVVLSVSGSLNDGGSGPQDGPTAPTVSIAAGRYGPWRVGDTHVHLVGDSGVLFNNRCRPNDEMALDDVMGSLDDCAARLVEATNRIATHNGLDWMVLTEHGPWLGSPQLVQCVDKVESTIKALALQQLGQSARCVRHASTFYSYSASVDAWRAIRDQMPESTGSGPDMLLGQEIGTAAGISALCATSASPLRALVALRRGPGHVGVYSLGGTQLPLRNTIFDCLEQHYLRDLQNEGLFGAINHPDNGDQGSDWHCWEDSDRHPSGEACHDGLASFTRSVLPIPVGDPLPPPAAVAAVAIVSDTKAPLDSTIINVTSQLREGQVLGFVGGSDAHAITRKRNLEQSFANDGKIGLAARTYAFAPSLPDESFGVDPIDHPVRFALASQATSASLGPLLSVQVEGVRAGGSVGLLDGNSVRMMIDWPSAPQTWPHIAAGSSGYEITSDQHVPRTNEASHRPETVEIFVIAIGSDCPFECERPPEPLRIDVPEKGSGPEETSAFGTGTDLDNGQLALDLVLPASTTKQWAVVVRGKYGPDIELADGRSYPVESWSSPIWIDATPSAALLATDDTSWDSSGMTASQPSTFSFPDQSFQATEVHVVDQRGRPVPNASIQLYRHEGDQLIPLPSRSRALASDARYASARTSDAGVYAFSIAPGSYVAVAAAPLCGPGTEPPLVALQSGDTSSDPVRLVCVDETSLPVEYRPINNHPDARDVEVSLVCAGDNDEIVVERRLLPPNETTELARVPLGWRCTATEHVPAPGPDSSRRLLTDEVRTERVTKRGVEFVSYTIEQPQPASFAIDALPYDPSEAGEAVGISLWCPGYETIREIDLVLGERYIVDEVFDGDTCQIAYLGNRLAYPPAELHEVDVFGLATRADEPFGNHEHDHEDDALFTLVELRFAADPVETTQVLPELSLPVVVASGGTQADTPRAQDEDVPSAQDEDAPPAAEPELRCEDAFELIGDRCARPVEPLRTVSVTPFVCSPGWELTSTACERTVEVRAPSTTTSHCPEGVVSSNNGQTCTRWIQEVDPVTPHGETECPTGTIRIAAGAGAVCEVTAENPDPTVCQEHPCESELVCPPGWNLVTTGPQTPRCASVDPRFAEPLTPARSCPQGSRSEGEACMLIEIIFEPVPPIVQTVCPDDFTLVDAQCLGTRIEQTARTGGVEQIALSCPPGSTEEGTSGSGVCIEYRLPSEP